MVIEIPLNTWQIIILILWVIDLAISLANFGEKRKERYYDYQYLLAGVVVLVLYLLAFGVIK